MVTLFTLAFVTALPPVGPAGQKFDKPAAAAKQLQIDVRVLEGDPLGSREAGTLKVLAEPRVVALENRCFSFLAGGQIAIGDGSGNLEFVPFGLRLAGQCKRAAGDKVRLDITLSNTANESSAEETVQLHTESMRTVTTIKQGEVVKFRFGKGTADKQQWAELVVHEVTVP